MRKAVVILLGALATGCSSTGAPEQRVCTLIGCSSGLTVVLEGGADGPFTIEASDGTIVETYECAAGARCERITFDDFTPERVTVRVIADGDTATTTAEPTYASLQPNGPGCPPTCRQATVNVRKP